MNRGRRRVVGSVKMFCVGQADQRFVKRGGLGGNSPLVQSFPVVGRTDIKGEMRLEPCMENNRVVVMTERFQALNECLHLVPVAFQKRQRVLNERDAHRHRCPHLDLFWKTNALQEPSNIIQLALVGFVKQSIVKPLNRR